MGWRFRAAMCSEDHVLTLWIGWRLNLMHLYISLTHSVYIYIYLIIYIMCVYVSIYIYIHIYYALFL